ncbi:hypothetical protein HaLaN_05918 [Haematococcus lacustris]|uniref:Uncharacterized protein n=1 Tax=Haematococcus lacustris TaxID=44745 RepID=A0A699YM41_HAELA|nr:hypothetical protein HaLaN_05918 [Haematococcus lacustris]
MLMRAALFARSLPSLPTLYCTVPSILHGALWELCDRSSVACPTPAPGCSHHHLHTSAPAWGKHDFRTKRGKVRSCRRPQKVELFPGWHEHLQMYPQLIEGPQRWNGSHGLSRPTQQQATQEKIFLGRLVMQPIAIPQAKTGPPPSTSLTSFRSPPAVKPYLISSAASSH